MRNQRGHNDLQTSLAILWLSLTISVFAAPAAYGSDGDDWRAAGSLLIAAAEALCPAALLAPSDLTPQSDGSLQGFAVASVEDRGPAASWVRRAVTLSNPASAQTLTLTATRTGMQIRRISLAVDDQAGARPLVTALADPDCRIHHGRALRYDGLGAASHLLHLTPDLREVESTEPLNPPVPAGQDPGGVTVAHVDSGVNYLLPEIASRLARDDSGNALGYDFWDLDDRPFDGDIGRSPFFPIRHGTPVASLLLEEAPDIRLLPFRYPRPDMTRMGPLVEAAAEAGATIVALPMGSRKAAEWTGFAEAAASHPDLLFVVSAGNDGRDIDKVPLYPAGLDLPNMLVVTSADAFGRLAAGSNWGARSVDLMVPAEQLEVTDYRGARGRASGSSYAVPRVAALAARLKAANPTWQAPDLKAAILARAVRPLDRGEPRVAGGWIPNPADDR